MRPSQISCLPTQHGEQWVFLAITVGKKNTVYLSLCMKWKDEFGSWTSLRMPVLSEGVLGKKKKKRTHPSVSLKLLMEFVFVFNAALNIISVAWIKVKYYCVCHWNALSRPDYTTKFQLSTVKLTHTDLIWNLHRCLQKQCRPLNYIQNRWMFSKLCLNGW